MSELSPIGTICPDWNIKSGAIGPVVSDTVAKIIDPEGKSLGPHQSGELVLKGPQVMMGYLNDPVRTAECLSPSGWLRSGDVAHYDEEGNFYITDRIKELIKVRGYQVAPAELEEILLSHPAIQDATVIPFPDEVSGELPRAYVIRRPNAPDVTESEIYEYVRERVAPYKRLEGGVVFTDVIPKSASGKILRRILRDQLAEEIKTGTAKRWTKDSERKA
jgi:4-coumarate--CoA ligase